MLYNDVIMFLRNQNISFFNVVAEMGTVQNKSTAVPVLALKSTAVLVQYSVWYFSK